MVDTNVVSELGRYGRKVTVNGDAKGVTDGTDAADDLSAINGGSVPGISGNMNSFGANFSGHDVKEGYGRDWYHHTIPYRSS